MAVLYETSQDLPYPVSPDDLRAGKNNTELLSTFERLCSGTKARARAFLTYGDNINPTTTHLRSYLMGILLEVSTVSFTCSDLTHTELTEHAKRWSKFNPLRTLDINKLNGLSDLGYFGSLAYYNVSVRDTGESVETLLKLLPVALLLDLSNRGFNASLNLPAKERLDRYFSDCGYDQEKVNQVADKLFTLYREDSYIPFRRAFVTEAEVLLFRHRVKYGEVSELMLMAAAEHDTGEGLSLSNYVYNLVTRMPAAGGALLLTWATIVELVMSAVIRIPEYILLKDYTLPDFAIEQLGYALTLFLELIRIVPELEPWFVRFYTALARLGLEADYPLTISFTEETPLNG